MSIFSWGSWDEPSDRFVGHPDSVEALAVLDEDTYVTGSGDGIVRKCSAFPNRLLAVIGAHDEGFPAERVRVGEFEGTRVVATATGHDGTVMFWDPDAEVSFGDMDGEASDEVDSDDEEDGQSNAGSSDDAEDVVADAPADGSSDDESDSSDEDMEGGDTSSEPAQGAKRKRATWTVTETTATANDEVKKEGKKKQTAAEVASDEDSDSDGADGSDSDDSGAGGARRDRKKKRVPDGKKSFTSKKGKPGAGAGFYADL